MEGVDDPTASASSSSMALPEPSSPTKTPATTEIAVLNRWAAIAARY